MGWNLEVGPYFLTGLPRSRTAWFSEWLPNCLHEGMNGCYSHAEYVRKLGNGGDSSSGLVYFPIRKYFPDAPVVIVQRPVDEVIESIKSIGLFNKTIYNHILDMQYRLSLMDGLRVDYSNIDLEEVWSHLIGSRFNRKRAEELSQMNIQKLDKPLDIEAFTSFMGEG